MNFADASVISDLIFMKFCTDNTIFWLDSDNYYHCLANNFLDEVIVSIEGAVFLFTTC